MAGPRDNDEHAGERARMLRLLPPLDECLMAAASDEALNALARGAKWF